MYRNLPIALLFLSSTVLQSHTWAKPLPSNGALFDHEPRFSESSRAVSVVYPRLSQPSTAPKVKAPTRLRRAAPTWEKYTVNAGDTAWSIAVSHGITLEELQAANPHVPNWDEIEIGQVLNLPSPDSGDGGHPSTPSTNPASGFSQVTDSLAVHNFNPDEGSQLLVDFYRTYQGDGSLQSGWPAKSQWLSFNRMWDHVQSGLGEFCVGGVQSTTAQEKQDIRDSILNVSADALIDPRFVLAVVLQESNGCVRVRATTSSDGIHNPGVMQTSNGIGSCNDGAAISPCPRSEIHQMILDGVRLGDNNLVKALNEAGSIPGLGQAEEAQAFYRAARMYNSGFFSFTDGADLAQKGAIECYSSDIGNRLLGWYFADYSCFLNQD
ncbi:uncharacterized protein A1O9_12367 [Exophiala aquamarina CBS 119918]|uniref:LysM domain-containing protein n=1 Tax=Exophiala aquamarina CBS 119918 TaxID=1182545 RepID=A0A072P773_9EURO|nr:uncharacterized protein A1O9_12367 [Exophiala aquamarina CBS 119918]KEF51450.1 hypothetical protein A1O9_12367 [Exophiala aquamarina CBS 119918]